MAPIFYNYQSVPDNDEGKEKDSEFAEAIPRSIVIDYLDTEHLERPKKQRRRTFRLLSSLLASCYMTFLYTRGLFPAFRGSRTGCHNGGPNRAVHGTFRNISTIKLPTFYTLPSGDKIPAVGLGVWRAYPSEVGQAVKVALEAGYRHIDGAWAYLNEHEVGDAIKQSSVPRQDIWITSKLWNTFHAPEDVERAVDDSLQKLGTDYIDLYLIHWPVAFKSDEREVDFDLTDNPYPTWKAMEELVKKGKVRNIGVSNFNVQRLQNLTANPLVIKPAINQVELSYWNPQPELLAWSKENGILLEAYSPLGSAKKVKDSLQIPEVKEIAKELGLSPAQVYISWHVQRGTVVLPKSVTPSRIKENFEVTALPADAIEKLEKLAANHKPSRAVDPSKAWGVDIFN